MSEISDKTIDAIQNGVDTKVIGVEGDEDFFTRPVFRAPLQQFQKDPQPATLGLHSLTALVSYIKSCLSHDETDFSFIHIESPTKVSVLTALYGESQQRDVLISATYDTAAFPWGVFQNSEEFNVFMQARFEQTEGQVAVLRVVGNIKEESVRQTADDGITQSVIGKQGIAMAQELKVPNPVNLQPFRTFPEVDQPESPFILRLKQGNPLPQSALFEADGGAWVNVARERIRKFLADALPEVTILA